MNPSLFYTSYLKFNSTGGHISDLQDKHGDQPELIGCKYDPSLQQQRSKHPEQQPQTQAGEQALKVHVLQVRVRGPAELHHLQTP